MDEAATCRCAAVDAVEDVYPDRLRDDIVAFVEDGSLAPGTLALRCARAVDDTTDLDAIANRAAGVQLIYDGLRLTRTLAHSQPWMGRDDQTQPNLDILAADVLVARGFYLLATTDAAGKAVETVRTFGREQTNRRSALEAADCDDGGDHEHDSTPAATDDVVAAPDGNGKATEHDRVLERDVLELAALAGTTAADGTPTPELYATLDDLESHLTADGFPSDLAFLPTVPAIHATIPPDDPTADDSVPQSAGDS
jgi:hypothetical protein